MSISKPSFESMTVIFMLQEIGTLLFSFHMCVCVCVRERESAWALPVRERLTLLGEKLTFTLSPSASIMCSGRMFQKCIIKMVTMLD
jgi:hypothetical protein